MPRGPSVAPVSDRAAPLIVFSQDTHMSPRIADVRQYCPEKYLREFDDLVDASRRAVEHSIELMQEAGLTQSASSKAYQRRHMLNIQTPGTYDMHARLRDFDRDGIAAAVVFHGALNGEPFPMATESFYFGGFLGDYPTDFQLELTAVGMRMYNRWLADAISIEPERHVGCAHVPNWDPEATRREIEWARDAGIQSVNWPAPRVGMIEYDNPVWDPVWSACEALAMPLNTHAGAVAPGVFGENPLELRHREALVQLEASGWPSRRGIHRMVFGGVFERHPDLKLVLTEVQESWWPLAMREMNAAYLNSYGTFKEYLPKKPSEYCSTNVFVGASFMASFEAEDAIDGDYAANVMWGSDYPHPEGSWKFPEAEDEASTTRLHLRHTFADLPPEPVQMILGENAVRLYGLDRTKLTAVAERIGAPTLDEIATPIDAIPDGWSNLPFAVAFKKVDPRLAWPG